MLFTLCILYSVGLITYLTAISKCTWTGRTKFVVYRGTTRTKIWITLVTHVGGWSSYVHVMSRCLFWWNLAAMKNMRSLIVIALLLGTYLTYFVTCLLLHLVHLLYWHSTWTCLSLTNLSTTCCTIQNFNRSISKRSKHRLRCRWLTNLWSLTCSIYSTDILPSRLLHLCLLHSNTGNTITIPNQHTLSIIGHNGVSWLTQQWTMYIILSQHLTRSGSRFGLLAWSLLPTRWSDLTQLWLNTWCSTEGIVWNTPMSGYWTSIHCTHMGLWLHLLR